MSADPFGDLFTGDTGGGSGTSADPFGRMFNTPAWRRSDNAAPMVEEAMHQQNLADSSAAYPGLLKAGKILAGPGGTDATPVSSPFDGLGSWLSSPGVFGSGFLGSTPSPTASSGPTFGGDWGNALRGGLTDFASSIAQPFVNVARDPGAYLRAPNATGAEQAAGEQNAMGMFNAIGGAAVPFGVPKAAFGRGSLGVAADARAATGSLGADFLKAAPDVVPGSLGDVGRTRFPEGAPVQNPAAGPLRERMGLDQSSLNATQDALPAPREQLALPPGDAMPSAIAQTSPRGSFWDGVANERQVPTVEPRPITMEDLRPNVVDTTARPLPDISTDAGFRQKIADAQARQAANPTPLDELANRAPVSRSDPGTGSFVNVPRTAEQTAAEAGRTTPAQQAFIDQQANDLAARSQQALDQQRSIGGLTARGIDTTPIGRADLGLKGERFAEPVQPLTMSDLRSRIGAERHTTESGWTLGLRETQVHDANTAVVEAMQKIKDSARPTDAQFQTVLDAWQQVKALGGSLDTTNARLRKAGLSKLPPEMVTASPRAAAVQELTQQGVLRGRGKGGTSAPAAPAVTALPDGGRGLLNRLGDAARKANADEVGGGRLPFDKNTRYGTPAEVAAERAANDPRLTAIGQVDPRLTAIGQAPTIGRDLLRADPNVIPGAEELAAAKAAYDARTLRDPAGRAAAESAGGKYVQTEGAPARPNVDPRLEALGADGGIPAGGRGPLTMDGLKNGVVDALNIPRTLMTTGDVSYSLRQGLVLAAGHPVKAVRAMGQQLKAFANEARAVEYSRTITSDPAYPILKDLGLSLTDWTGKLGPMEEGFLSKSLGNAPIVRNSNRAGVTFLNSLRFNVAKDALRAAEIASPRTISATRQSQLKGLMDFINAASGRSELPKAAEKYGNALNGLFFSPRFFLSRLNVAAAPIKAITTRNPLLAKEAARDISALVIGGMGVMQLAKMNGATVVDDPTSTDWGKIQVGNTRIDIWGGFQQPARFVSQMIAGHKTSISGKQTVMVDNNPIGDLAMGATGGGVKTKSGFLMHPDSRAYEAGRFIRGKLAPVPGTVVDMLSGKNYIGQDATPQSKLGNSVTPLAFQDIYDAIADDLKNGGSGVRGGAVGSLGLAGVGLTTIPKDYANTPTIPEAAFGAAFQGKPFFTEDAQPKSTTSSSGSSSQTKKSTSPLLRALQTAKPRR